ncbi:MAG: GTP-binding protein [Campylobacterota bacterium]|nr:GTP-binding protein [Campylobacterota bacterium]
MKQCKVLITGPFNSGKTQFIKSISDIKPITTERIISSESKKVKKTTTVAMDYGRVNVDNIYFHLFGTPGQERFDFMWSILSLNIDTCLFLIDSVSHNFDEAENIISYFNKQSNNIPKLIVATKQDLPQAQLLSQINKHFLRYNLPIMACNAKNKKSVHRVLLELKKFL